MTIPGPLAAHTATSHWIAFAPDNRVIVKTGRVELDQGIAAALTRIAAVELSVDPAQITLVAGDTSQSPNEGPTVASISVQIGGMALRWAASAARHEMLARAAQLLQTTPEVLDVAQGAILHRGADTGLTYWTLAENAPLDGTVIDYAAPMALSGHPAFDPAPRRADILSRLRGEGYIQDLVFADMLHGRIIHPPYGTTGLITAQDRIAALAGDRVRLFRNGLCLGLTCDCEFEANRAALRLSQHLDWKTTPLDFDPMDALNDPSDTPTLATDIGSAPVDPLTISTSVTRPCIAHASIGPCCALAIFDENRLQVWSHSQGVFALRDSLAAVLDLSPEAVTVRFTPGSGCYGHNGADDVALDAALLARANPGRHVRAIWSREDEFRAAPFGPAMRTTASASLSPDGQITGLRIEVQSPAHSTRPRGPAAPNLRAAQFLDPPIPLAASLDPPASAGGGSDRNAIPLYAFDRVQVWKCPPPRLGYRPSSFRSLGAQVNVAAIEALIEEVAIATNTDPIQLRLTHLTDPRARHVIETVRKMADAAPQSDEVIRGLGFARYKNSAAYCAVIAELAIDTEIAVRAVWATVDAGEVIDPSGLRNQIEGGIVQAVSITLGEQVHFGANGPETQLWEDYPILGFSAVPRIEISVIETLTQPALGVGEVAAGPTTAAILNAASQGLGQRLTQLPLTRDNLTRQLLT